MNVLVRLARNNTMQVSLGYPGSRARFDVFFSEKLRLYAISELFVFIVANYYFSCNFDYC